MNAPRKIQIGLGALLFTVGFLLEAAAVTAFVAPDLASFLPTTPVLAHLAAALLLALGGALVATARVRGAQTIGLTLLFGTLALILPIIGPFAVLIFTVILAWHSWRKLPAKIPLAKIPALDISNASPCPVDAPLVGLLTQLSPAKLQKTLLGMARMPPRDTRPLLKTLQKHRDVRVLLYANGLLNDHLNLFEKRLAALQDLSHQNPRDEITLTALVETYAELIEHKLIPADEIPQTAKRALAAAVNALALDPANAPVLAIKARFELLVADFPTAYRTIQQLYALPDCFEQARLLHAQLLFQHSATRPVQNRKGVPVTPPTLAKALN